MLVDIIMEFNFVQMALRFALAVDVRADIICIVIWKLNIRLISKF